MAVLSPEAGDIFELGEKLAEQGLREPEIIQIIIDILWFEHDDVSTETMLLIAMIIDPTEGHQDVYNTILEVE